MSKLRATITWNHRQKSNSVELSPPGFLENANDQTNINNEENQESEEDSDPEKTKETEESGEIKQESEEFVDLTLNQDCGDDESLDSSALEADFGQFLDVWVEILVEETEEFTGIEEEENGEMLSSEIGNITHPAVDPNAKWDLNTLFNELQLP